jgi:hypothetical protein
MKRCRLKRSNFQIKNKMSKENKTSDKQQNDNDFIADVSGSLLSEIRQAVAAYMWSEGCSCCRSDNHDENGERLAVLLGVKKYDDGSGYDWESVRKQ